MAATAQEHAEEAQEDARIEDSARRVLELRREAEALLAALPPALRARVEERVAELLRQGDAPPASQSPAEQSAAAPVAAVVTPAVPAPSPAPNAPAVAAREDGRSVSAGSTGSGCAALAAFDRDDDGIVSAIDRAWRHLYLWRDDGDDAIEPAETVSLYELGVRALQVVARTYTTASGFVGDLEVGESIELAVPQRGRDASFARGELVVDNDGLRRAGEPSVRTSAGAEPPGFQPLRRGYHLVSSDGVMRELPCGD